MDWAELRGYLSALSRFPTDQLLQYDSLRDALQRWRDKVGPPLSGLNSCLD